MHLGFGPGRVVSGGGGSGAPALVWATTNYLSTGLAAGDDQTVTNVLAADAANTLALVNINYGGSTTWPLPTNCTINGTMITNNLLWYTNDANWLVSACYYLVDPPSGMLTNVITLPENFDQQGFSFVILTNAAQSSTFGTPVSDIGNDTNPKVDLTGAATTDLAFGNFTTDSQNSMTANQGGIIALWVNVGGDTDHGAVTNGGSGTVTVGVTTDSGPWAGGGVLIHGP